MIDPLFGTVEYALGGLQARTDAIADNMANSNTPLYHAKRVQFEDALSSALQNGKAAPDTAPYTVNDQTIPDGQGNSVNLEQEMTDMAKTALARQTLTSGFNYKIGVYKTAVGK